MNDSELYRTAMQAGSLPKIQEPDCPKRISMEEQWKSYENNPNKQKKPEPYGLKPESIEAIKTILRDELGKEPECMEEIVKAISAILEGEKDNLKKGIEI